MIKKDITFIYYDTAEYTAYQPIVEEAKKRGYKVKLTKNPFEKCEIGFYCQHNNFPQYSKFSVIMLHDIIQNYGAKPDFWFYEPWDKYDIGILPSKKWTNDWKEVSNYRYTRPRKGIYEIGWPKADYVLKYKDEKNKKFFYETNGMNMNRPTILYAPAWENDGKQDDFVKAMQKLDVNILIKQANWNPEKFPQQVANIQEMRILHKNLENVTVLDPKVNIFEAISNADILVSEESSTMCEAVMLGVPAVSVSDWLIPDTTPSRTVICEYDFVTKTYKDQLTDCIKEMLENYDDIKKETQEWADRNFSNIGSTSTKIMDVLDAILEGKEPYIKKLEPNMYLVEDMDRVKANKVLRTKREILFNYCERNFILRKVRDKYLENYDKFH